MSTFAKMKAASATSIDKLREAASKLSGGGEKTEDQNVWSPTVDKAGNGYAILRFLPSPDGEDIPWIRFWDHGFKGPTGKWYIEKSLTSIGQNDPVSEVNSALWATGLDSNKEIVRQRKRRLHYVTNVLVVSDPANPGTEGKVFKFKFGKKIFDKIIEAMTPNPQFQDEIPVNVFDLWKGANFKLKIRQVEGYRNYDKSEFDKPTALFGGDDTKLEALVAQLHSLKEYLDPKGYKSYDELKKRLTFVLGSEVPMASAPAPEEAKEQRTEVAPASRGPAPADVVEADEDEGPGSASYFQRLANGG